MKSNRTLKLPMQIALVALALYLLPGLGMAQDAYQGKFTLPFEAHWGIAVLPAGDYTISMATAASPYLLYVRGAGKTAIILAEGVDTKPLSDHSQLTVVNTAGNQAITMLEAGQIGLTLDYPVSTSVPERMAGAKRKAGAKSISELIVSVRGASDSAAGLSARDE